MDRWERLASTFVAMTTPLQQTRSDNLKLLLEGPVDRHRLEAARLSLAQNLEPLVET